MSIALFKLKDLKETYKFEKEHPKPIRWDEKYKEYLLSQKDGVQGIWLREGKELIAEVILTWTSSNVIHGDSFTVLPEHRGKGIGHDIIRISLDWASEMGYTHFIGEARKGASWTVFQDFGAEEILTYKNWSGTNEEYVSFKIEL